MKTRNLASFIANNDEVCFAGHDIVIFDVSNMSFLFCFSIRSSSSRFCALDKESCEALLLRPRLLIPLPCLHN